MEFNKFPKIPRYNRDCIITEKIDGTNAQIFIVKWDTGVITDVPPGAVAHVTFDYGRTNYAVYAGSRNRWLTTQEDNHGFAKWVAAHANELVNGLGVGTHYGEWWGQGIQRKYGLAEHRFSLFNVIRWNPEMYYRFKTEPWMKSLGPDGKPRKGAPAEPKLFSAPPACCHVVPVLAVVPFDCFNAGFYTTQLAESGSVASPGYMKPEGIVIYHVQGHILFKKTFDDDGGKHESK